MCTWLLVLVLLVVLAPGLLPVLFVMGTALLSVALMGGVTLGCVCVLAFCVEVVWGTLPKDARAYLKRLGNMVVVVFAYAVLVGVLYSLLQAAIRPVPEYHHW
jgi:4-amino-4-deoxy-L-arabinose transferase-like glycosyltransferase